MKSKQYAELVTQAETATKAIKDPELRRVAFERVLEDLLSGAGSTSSSRDRASGKPRDVSGVKQSEKKVSGPRGYVREMLADGFFKKPKTIAEVKAELANRGHHIAITSLSGPLQKLCQKRELRRHKSKANEKGKKIVFSYSEW